MFERFWQRVDKTDTCWNWTGKTNDKGYGYLHCMGMVESAHRISYVISISPIPDGLMVLHSCDNRRCVRPDHLFLGTAKDNSDDMYAKGRSYTQRVRNPGILNGRSHLTESQVREIRALYKETSLTFREIGQRFGISKGQASKVARRLAWRDLP